MIVVLQSNHWILFFIAWEIFNMSLYAIIIGNNIDRQKALSASMKYFTLSALSTAFLLLGLAMIYHTIGDLSFSAVYGAMYFRGLTVPIIFIIFALLFKLSAVPVHFWSPDLYSVTPLPITSFISNVPKVFYFSVIIILLDELHLASNLYLFFGLISLIIGSIGLAQQKTIKRFLAFSAIINVGYILIIIQNPSIAIYNIALYILPNINVFMILIAMNNYFNKDDIDNIDELSGFFAKNPFMTLSFVVSIFSIAGIPPLPGFFAKYNLLVAAYNFLPYYLFIIVLISSVIAVASYLKILYIALFSSQVNKYQIKIDDNIVLTTIIAFNFVIFGILSYCDLMSLLTLIIKI
jgi:NADH-quinone oxidoreductase subunit N